MTSAFNDHTVDEEVEALATVVCKAVGEQWITEEGRTRVRRPVVSRFEQIFSAIPAERTTAARWLMEAARTDAPSHVDFCLAVMLEALHEVAAFERLPAPLVDHAERRLVSIFGPDQ